MSAVKTIPTRLDEPAMGQKKKAKQRRISQVLQTIKKKSRPNQGWVTARSGEKKKAKE